MRIARHIPRLPTSEAPTQIRDFFLHYCRKPVILEIGI
jgi:hypothetical protein